MHQAPLQAFVLELVPRALLFLNKCNTSDHYSRSVSKVSDGGEKLALAELVLSKASALVEARDMLADFGIVYTNGFGEILAGVEIATVNRWAKLDLADLVIRKYGLIATARSLLNEMLDRCPLVMAFEEMQQAIRRARQ